MPFPSFRSKRRPQRASALPVPPPVPAKSPDTENPPQRRYLRWIVVLVLGTGIAAARLYYPDILDEAIQFADALWPPAAWMGSTPIAPATPTATPVPVSTPISTPAVTVAAAGVADDLSAQTVEAGTDLPAEPDTGAVATPAADPDPAPDPARMALLGPGVHMTGRVQEPYVTLWAYPGTSTGHLAVHRYDVATVFEVVEPERTIGAYPVERNGVFWVRVQADDGLVGWARTSELEETEGTERP